MRTWTVILLALASCGDGTPARGADAPDGGGSPSTPPLFPAASIWYQRVDGTDRPPDFVTGEAAATLRAPAGSVQQGPASTAPRRTRHPSRDRAGPVARWSAACSRERAGGNMKALAGIVVLGSLLSLDFDEHKIARKLVQPAFTLKAIEGYLEILDRGFIPAIAAWREKEAHRLQDRNHRPTRKQPRPRWD